jgi:Icc-related predicted phosphoesterase
LHNNNFYRIFFVTDIHGSQTCFRKFLSAPKVYKADILILGGDITGKVLIPITDLEDGTYRAFFLGKEQLLKSPEELQRLEQTIADSGYYYFHASKRELEGFDSSKEAQERKFLEAMKSRLADWVNYGEKILKESQAVCYFTGGNDDFQEVLDSVNDSDHIKNTDNKVILLESGHELASLGWSNMTPWKCPRDCSEEDLQIRIEKLISSINDPSKSIFNFHVPPVNSGLDTAVKLDDSVNPPKPIIQSGEPMRFGAGSVSVRRTIEQQQPLLDLCGHIHESSGVCRIGRTLVINPGSEYGEGVLRGVLVNLRDKKIHSWQLVSA